MPIIEAEHLSKSYRAADKNPGLIGTLRHFVRRRYRLIEAVRDVSFKIEPGEIVGFLGPNGAGKTTALKMLSGLIHPSSGLARVNGFTPFDRHAAFLRGITLVMGQKQQLIWDLPVLDSLRINASVYDVPEPEARLRIAELSAMLGLDRQLTQPVRKLSLGERMKAELMAALLHRPAILFLDEPTLGLDVNAQASVRDFLLQYNQRHGATVLLTSHYMADITALCRRVMLIDKGRLVYDGDLAAMVERWAPCREVRLDLRRPCLPAELERFGQVVSIEGLAARLLIRREDLTRLLPRILSELDVEDLTVADPPIEQIIGQVFTNGAAT